MKRAVFAALVLIVAGLCHAVTVRAAEIAFWSWSADAPRHQAIVAVRVQSGGGVSKLGSGVYIRHGQLAGVLTAAHCIGQSVEVTFSDGAKAVGEGLVSKDKADVGFCVVTHPTLTPVEFAPAAPQVGDVVEVASLGGPERRLRHFWARVERVAGMMDYDSPVVPGDSGGAVFNQRGQVVSVMSHGRESEVPYMGTTVYAKSSSPTHAAVGAFLVRVATLCPPGGCLPRRRPQPVPPPELYPPHTPGPLVPVPPPEPAPEAPAVPAKPSPVPSPSVPSPAAPPVAPVPSWPDGLKEQLQALRERLESGAAGAVASGAMETLLPGLLTALGWTGPPAIALVVATKLLSGLLAARRRNGAEAAMAPAPAKQAKTGTAEAAYQPPADANDYVKHWMAHFRSTGGNLREEAVKGPLYVEALQQLKEGRINVQPTAEAMAAGLHGWVHREFARRGEILPQGDLPDAGYVGFLYRDAVERLRTGMLPASGFREAYDSVHAWVSREFVNKVHRTPQVNFLPGDRL